MYECPDVTSDLTFHELRQWRLATGRDQPDMIGSLNLDELTIATGAPLGWSARPGPQWQRLPWSGLADRLGVRLGESDVPPCFRWFPYRSWPARIRPPAAGSLDEESMAALLRQLAARSPAGLAASCHAYYTPVASGGFDSVALFRGPLEAVPGLVDAREHRFGSPSNFWPDDRSWLVYTDWDLWATKVSGSHPLIEDLIADPGIETFEWWRPAGRNQS